MNFDSRFYYALQTTKKRDNGLIALLFTKTARRISADLFNYFAISVSDAAAIL